jgi:hypothetical protein
LQGREAAFIHHLTILGEKYDYSVVSNQHDGLGSINPIPDEAVQEAIRLSGLECAKIVEKPFIDAPPPMSPSAHGFGTESNSYTTAINQHDGIGTINPIDEAVRFSGLECAKIEEKPFNDVPLPPMSKSKPSARGFGKDSTAKKVRNSPHILDGRMPLHHIDGSMYLPPVDMAKYIENKYVNYIVNVVSTLSGVLENISEEEEEAIVDRARNTFSNILKLETTLSLNKRKLLEMWRWIQLKRLVPKIYSDDYSIEEKHRYAHYGLAIAEQLSSNSSVSSSDSRVFAFLLVSEFRILLQGDDW